MLFVEPAASLVKVLTSDRLANLKEETSLKKTDGVILR